MCVFLIVSTISFDLSTCNFDEFSGQTHHMLAIDKPLLSDVVVQIMDFSITAISEFHILATYIHNNNDDLAARRD